MLREVGGVRDVEAPVGIRGGPGRDGAARSGVGAGEPDVDEDGQLLRDDGTGDRLGGAQVGSGERGGRRHARDDPAEPLVEVLEPGEVVQDALLDPQWPRRERLARLEVDELPVAERAGGRERAPVRIRERGEREPEGRPLDELVPCGACAQPGEARVELDPGTEQQHVALERGEPEAGGHAFEARRLLPDRVSLRLGTAAGPALEVRADPGELGHEGLLVLLRDRHSVAFGSE